MSLLRHRLTTFTSRLSIRTMSSNTNNKPSGTDASHAKPGGSHVPDSIQQAAPKAVEDALPNTLHDTGKTGSKSHAERGGSILPESIQQIVPERAERLVPNAIHDTGDKKVSDPLSKD